MSVRRAAVYTGQQLKLWAAVSSQGKDPTQSDDHVRVLQRRTSGLQDIAWLNSAWEWKGSGN